MSRFFDAVEKTVIKHQELLDQLENSSVSGDYQKANKINQELKKIGLIVEKYNEYKLAKARIQSTLDVIGVEKDPDIIELAQEEIRSDQNLINNCEKQLKALMIPQNPNDEKNVIIEIRGAAGGDEANIFCGDLFRLYSRYAENKRYEIEILNSYPANQGGFTQISFLVKGKGAYSRLKFENGVHRVQRVPRTESQGRTHTSTASVVVMPEIKESELVINPAELRIDTYRASGSGGQHVNKTDSAVRITHLPTNIVAASQDGRSQHDNRDKAMRQLRAKIQESIDKAKEKELKEIRLKSVGSGDRSEKIRTYNYPQNRITDHRINLTLMKLDVVMEGNLDEIIEALVAAEQEEKLEQTTF